MSSQLADCVGEYSVSELESGFRREGDVSTCIVCAAAFREGLIYPVGEQLATAEVAARHHVQDAHGGMIRVLTNLPKGVSGLTDIQSSLIALLGEGLSDKAIARTMDGKAESTIRNHRFQLRRRVAEARVLAALGDLLDRQQIAGPGGVERGEALSRSSGEGSGKFVRYHHDIPTLDDRIVTTVAEATEIAGRLFEPGDTLHLTRFPRKEKEKLVVLKRIVEEFELDTDYTERDVNAVLMRIYDDYVTIRRYLIEYRFMEREPDGSRYRRHA